MHASRIDPLSCACIGEVCHCPSGEAVLCSLFSVLITGLCCFRDTGVLCPMLLRTHQVLAMRPLVVRPLSSNLADLTTFCDLPSDGAGLLRRQAADHAQILLPSHLAAGSDPSQSRC